MNPMKDDLLKLVRIPGPSGFEAPVAQFISREISPFVDRVEVDGVGNLLASKEGPEGAPVMMLMAHMDEVSMVVTAIPDGFVRFDYVGSIYPACIVAHPLTILTESGPVPGVVGSPSYHMGQGKLDELWIDVGGRADRVKPGDPIIFDAEPRWLDDEERILASKALDNRTGCAILMDLARRIQGAALDITLIFTFTVQEEVFARGAQYAAKIVHPRWVISVDGGAAANPSMGPESGCHPLGKALLLRRYETIKPQRGVLTYWADPGLLRGLTRAGEKAGIPLHYDVKFNVYTDAAGASESWMDIRCAGLSVPRRYGHAPLEIAHMDTMEMAVVLLRTFLMDAPGRG